MDTRPLEIVCQGMIKWRGIFIFFIMIIQVLESDFDSEHSDDDSSDDEEGDVGVDSVNIDNVRELAAGADDGVAAVPQLPGHEDQGGGAAADGQ